MSASTRKSARTMIVVTRKKSIPTTRRKAETERLGDQREDDGEAHERGASDLAYSLEFS